VAPLDWNDNHLFRSLFDNLSDAVFLFEWTEQGEPGRFVEFNQRAIQLLGYAREELLTLSYAAVQSPEYSEKDRQAFHSLAMQERLLFRTELICKTGIRIPVGTNACLSTWNNMPVTICVVHDITPRQQVEMELRHRIDLERLIADTSTRFANPTPGKFKTLVCQALQAIGEFVTADQCYLTLLVEGTHVLESSLGWRAPGIESAGVSYNGISIDQFSWTMERLKCNEVIQVDDVSMLPLAATAEKEIWSREGIYSLVMIPIFLEDVLAAFLGLNFEHRPIEKKWLDTDFRLLRVMADIFASALARKRYEERRAALDRDLERTVLERTAQLQESETRLRALARQVVEAQEGERLRISHELHDDAGQVLNVLKIRLNLVRAEASGDSHRIMRQGLDDALHLIDQALESIRRLAHGLRPAGLDTAGLHPSLEGYCHEFARQTGLPVTYRGEEIQGLADVANIALYRCLQETLTNVLKHAQANQVWVTLERNAHHVTLTVRDDGQGFDAAESPRSPSRGTGLQGLRERFELAGGDVAIESCAGQGTRIKAQVPWRQPE
jgi:PAS domain S-box-containing protein